MNKKLTRSSGHRADFNQRRLQANVQRKLDDLPALKALLSGHGIRWGIQAERWERMWEARQLIDRVMRDDLTEVHSKKHRPRKDGKKHGYFESLEFSVGDWQAMRDMLDILTPYKILTRQMEGDKPTGCMVIAKYVELKSSMERRLKKMHINNPLYPMVDVMIGKIKTYQDEAIECDTLVLAAIFHPGLRVRFFSHVFGEDSVKHQRAQELLQSVFTSEQDATDLRNQPPSPTQSADSPKKVAGPSFLHLYDKVVTSSNLNELDRYLQGIDPMVSPDVNNPEHALEWWSTHEGKYPVL